MFSALLHICLASTLVETENKKHNALRGGGSPSDRREFALAITLLVKEQRSLLPKPSLKISLYVCSVDGIRLHEKQAGPLRKTGSGGRPIKEALLHYNWDKHNDTLVKLSHCPYLQTFQLSFLSM